MEKEDKLSIEFGIKSIGQMSIKDVDMSKRVVTGVYNAYNFFDSDMDVLVMGAAKNSIDQHGPKSSAVWKIKHALNHDLSQLPGKIEVLDEREVEIEGKKVEGIYFETKMTKSQKGLDTLINYQEEVYDNHSIGFRYLDIQMLDEDSDNWDKVLDTLINPDDAEKEGTLFLVKEIELFEGSTVAIGANKLTPFLGVKSGNQQLQMMKLIDKVSVIEKQLKKGKQSDEMLYDFSIQLRQIKQLLSEIEVQERSTSDKKRPESDFNFCDSLQNINFFEH